MRNSTIETLEIEGQQAQDEITAQRRTDVARFGHFTPYHLRCPLDAIEDVARGLRSETEIRFLLARHVVVVGGDEWDLDGDLELWQKARAYAGELNHQGYLKMVEGQGELLYQKRKEAKMTKRERALNLANKALGPIEEGKQMPDAQIILSYALVLVLIEISEHLERIKSAQSAAVWE